MKPRPRRAALTEDDWYIWLQVCERADRRSGQLAGLQLYEASVTADRRDADLMLFIGESDGQMRVDHQGDPDGDFSAVFFPRARQRWEQQQHAALCEDYFP